MPFAGTSHSSLLQHGPAPYFVTLAELDAWIDSSATSPITPGDGILSYSPRSTGRRDDSAGNLGQRGKLLVCHDYKGGYTESTTAMGYTFNFWSYCDIFVYFSHHRVTVPPSGWTTAAHRQGVKMLGTLIFENGADEDCLRLIVGRLPSTQTFGSASTSSAEDQINYSSLPLSPHYARVLAKLASQRGFDGYLLNFECPLQGGVEQCRALAAWISLFRVELQKQVGPHAEVIWYDSVIFNGQLRWQDRLNVANMPFFLPSTGFFTNYTWPNHFPHSTASYLLSFPFPLIPAPPNSRTCVSKTLSDIYTGIDVWGRGSHGGGGFGAFRALEHISPQELGLSVAVFGQAWTWESEQDKAGFTWDVWWAYERKLWLGSSRDGIELPEMKPRQGETPCEHGGFRPITEFFVRKPATDPSIAPFCTTFSPGVGFAWWINGIEMMRQEKGWTDVGKQGSLGDVLWPTPQVLWEGDEGMRLPRAAVSVEMRDAWIGGSCVNIILEDDGSARNVDDQDNDTTEEAAMFRCVWVPIQAINASLGIPYTAVLVYKAHAGDGIDLDIGLSAKLSRNGEAEDRKLEVDIVSLGVEELGNGWSELRAQILSKAPWDTSSPDGSDPTPKCSAVDVGMIIGIALDDPASGLDVRISLGMLTMYPSLVLNNVTQTWPKVLWAHFDAPAPVPSTSATAPTSLEANRHVGTLTWDTGAAFSALPPSALPPINSPEDAVLVWTLPDDQGQAWFPAFLYFNVSAAPIFATGVPVPAPECAIFIGTTGVTGLDKKFRIEQGMMPEVQGKEGLKGWRWYVQGVTNRGEVLPWDKCAYADWMI